MLGFALLVTGYLTAVLGGQVDPVTDPVSDYAFHSAGGPLFVSAVLLLGLAGLVLRAGMHGARMPRSLATSALFGLWYAGLLLCAVFPGDQLATDQTLSGQLHRLGGAMLFTCLPVAGWLLARALHPDPRWTGFAVWIRRFAAAVLACAAMFGAAQLVPWLPKGLIERVALGAELALLVVLALAVRKAARCPLA
ncbi:hypothetical protein AOZ06_08580 [Kibdelosporangium phytohabitans]|uniref:DUF998 domain-containing protein n=1 Tax=Kibdelosporangium phytohabitans TaxID=860235 RepID=A0A0N7F5M4_9PSEU|nr:hypothetical protein AOZ06_08580 [Kibdelosporangium phytohabitans]